MGILLFVLKYMFISLLLKMINWFSWSENIMASPFNNSILNIYNVFILLVQGAVPPLNDKNIILSWIFRMSSSCRSTRIKVGIIMSFFAKQNLLVGKQCWFVTIHNQDVLSENNFYEVFAIKNIWCNFMYNSDSEVAKLSIFFFFNFFIFFCEFKVTIGFCIRGIFARVKKDICNVYCRYGSGNGSGITLKTKLEGRGEE